jgi:hypothetical protein
LIFQKRPHEAGTLLAERSYVLEKFFQGKFFFFYLSFVFANCVWPF